MDGSSSNTNVAMEVDSDETLLIKPRTMVMAKEELKHIIESVVDFEALKRNDCDLLPFIGTQGWMLYFQMLHGPSYIELVKDLWAKAEVYDEEAAKIEELQKIQQNRTLKGKTRAQMGLEEFKEMEIRSAMMGIRIIITEENIAKETRCATQGMFLVNIKKNSEWTYAIVKTLYEGRPSNKTYDMKEEHMVRHKLILECFMPRDGGTD